LSGVAANVRTVPDSAPDLADLRRAAEVFNRFARADTAWLRFAEATSPAADLSLASHRDLLLRFLNAWGCRIRYPRAGEAAPFDAALSAWWQSWRSALPQVSLARLEDSDIDAIAAAYAALVTVRVSDGRPRRTLGPTAAAKALYALRPEAVVPWDATIAIGTQGGRDGAAFGQHLRLCRAWAAAVIAEAGVGDSQLPALIGRPAVPLAKILDEYLYVTFTMKASDRPASQVVAATTAVTGEAPAEFLSAP
jgi:hypothetical protein